MRDLYFHVSDEKHRTLLPMQNDNYEKAICLSLNKFISYLGQYVYIFDREILEKNVAVHRNCTNGVSAGKGDGRFVEYRFKGQSLEHEYRVYEPIDVEALAIGVFEHFNHTKGVVEKYLERKLVETLFIDLAKR